MKKVNYLIATLLVFGLTLNVIDGVKVDFQESSLKLELKEVISQTIDLPDNPWPDSSALKCRCKKENGVKYCGASNYISFNSKCAELADGTGECGLWSMNCSN
jgi:hypothetical protein